jgi:uncharacterized protein
VDTWDETKRPATLAERDLDFADAVLIFAGAHFTRRDDRQDYREPRFITAGYLGRRFWLTGRHAAADGGSYP